VTALQHISRILPIVFAAVADPVGAGIADSLDPSGQSMKKGPNWALLSLLSGVLNEGSGNLASPSPPNH
jgi:hypothetical protein